MKKVSHKQQLLQIANTTTYDCCVTKAIPLSRVTIVGKIEDLKRFVCLNHLFIIDDFEKMKK